MMMYHSTQSQRYGRPKGMKVKHLVQLIVLTVLFTWFIYQLSNSHRMKALSRRADKEDKIDDDLLISSNSENKKGLESEKTHVITPDELEDEFIDRKSVESDLKSRRMGPPNMPELDQSMAEGDRMEDALDDSDQGDRDERDKLDDQIMLVTETKAKKGRKDQKGRHKGVTETAEDRGDGEDEMAETIMAKEFSDSEAWTSTNLTEPVEDDTLIYTSEDSKVKGVDVSEEKTSTNAIEANADDKTELAVSESSDERQALKTTGDGENFTKLDDDKIDQSGVSNGTQTSDAPSNLSEATDTDKNLQISEMITAASDQQSAQSTSILKMLDESDSQDSNDEVSIISRSPHQLNEETVDATVSPQNGEQVEAVLEDGAGDEHERAAILGDGDNSDQLELNVKSVSEDQPLHPETVVEVVSEVKQDEPERPESTIEVVSEVEQDEPVQPETTIEVVPDVKQDELVPQEAIVEVVNLAKQDTDDGE